jgi:hypothetical protein
MPSRVQVIVKQVFAVVAVVACRCGLGWRLVDPKDGSVDER